MQYINIYKSSKVNNTIKITIHNITTQQSYIYNYIHKSIIYK